MASLRYRSGGWDLRYRERSGKERTERFRGGSSRRPPPSALERKGSVEAQLIRGTYVSRDLREQTFRVYYDRWVASRRGPVTRTQGEPGPAGSVRHAHARASLMRLDLLTVRLAAARPTCAIANMDLRGRGGHPSARPSS